jgi:hypothetical protein
MGSDIDKQIQESVGNKGASSLGHSVDFSVTAKVNGIGALFTTFVPSANAIRTQAAVMLKRLLQYAQFIN